MYIPNVSVIQMPLVQVVLQAGSIKQFRDRHSLCYLNCYTQKNKQKKDKKVSISFTKFSITLIPKSNRDNTKKRTADLYRTLAPGEFNIYFLQSNNLRKCCKPFIVYLLENPNKYQYVKLYMKSRSKETCLTWHFPNLSEPEPEVYQFISNT